MNKKTSIRKYRPQDKSNLIELLKFIWKNLDESEIKEQFEWRYENNPYTDKPYIYLGFVGNKLVGFRGMVVQNFTIKNKKIVIFCPADAIVRSDFQRIGLFSKLTKALLYDVHKANKSLILNLSSNQLSTSGNLKLGWQKTNGLKKSCYRISLVNYILTKLKIKNTPCLSNNDFIVKTKNNTLTITKKLFAEELASIVDQNRQQTKISNIRDLAYFKWRYSFKPDIYTYVYYHNSSKLIGYLIIKKSSDTDYSLLEYLSDENIILRWMINKTMQKLRIPLLRSWILSNQDNSLMKNCKFITKPIDQLKFNAINPLPILVRPPAPETTENDFFVEEMDIRDINNWQIFLADKH